MTSEEWESRRQRIRKELPAWEKLRDAPEHRRRTSPKTKMAILRVIGLSKRILEME